MNEQLKSKLVNDLFAKMASLAELPDEEYQKRIDEHLKPENIKASFEAVFLQFKSLHSY
jgi:hypothetical protein